MMRGHRVGAASSEPPPPPRDAAPRGSGAADPSRATRTAPRTEAPPRPPTRPLRTWQDAEDFAEHWMRSNGYEDAHKTPPRRGRRYRRHVGSRDRSGEVPNEEGLTTRGSTVERNRPRRGQGRDLLLLQRLHSSGQGMGGPAWGPVPEIPPADRPTLSPQRGSTRYGPVTLVPPRY